MSFRRSWRALTGVASLLACLNFGSALLASSPAGASSATGFYLSIGASESVGFQPTARYPHGQLTNEGYANDLVTKLAVRGVPLQLTQLGCPGESTSAAISGVDHCVHTSGSQLTDAVAFLRAHANQSGLVTVDLGFNNLRPCIQQEFTNPSCVTSQLATVRSELSTIVQTLLAVAGPKVTIVGLNHNDPFLADAVNRTRDLNFATDSANALNALNATLSDVYHSFSLPVADVAGAFANSNVAPARLMRVGLVPLNEIRACHWTWMCRLGANGPNLHPNDTGYHVIADAVLAALPQSFWVANPPDVGQ